MTKYVKLMSGLLMILILGSVNIAAGPYEQYGQWQFADNPVTVDFDSSKSNGFATHDSWLSNAIRISEGTMKMNQDATRYYFEFNGAFEPWAFQSKPFGWKVSHYRVRFEVKDLTTGSYVGPSFFTSDSDMVFKAEKEGNDYDMYFKICDLIKKAQAACHFVKLMSSSVSGHNKYWDAGDTGNDGYLLYIDTAMLGSVKSADFVFKANLNNNIFQKNHKFRIEYRVSYGIDAPTGYVYSGYTSYYYIDNTSWSTGSSGGGGGGGCSIGSGIDSKYNLGTNFLLTPC